MPMMRAEKDYMPKFQFECGEHSGVIKAKTLGEAWRKLTKNKTKGFAPLARFVEAKPGAVWKYITPQALDRRT
jgi:hypothetical protein